MGMEEFLAAMGGMGESKREPMSTEDFQPFLSYFDDRDFPDGSFIQKRRDGKQRTEGGMINYKYPLPGEPALVVGHCVPIAAASSGGYENENLVILTFDSGRRPIRISVDPVHFERFELPGEKMLRETGEERA